MAFSTLETSAKRMRIYIGDSDRWQGKPLYAVLLEQLKHEGLAGATVLRGVAGFGAHSRIHTASIIDLSTDLPLIIEVIDSPEKIYHVYERISPMVREGLITLEDVEVLSYTHRFLHPLPADRHVGEVMTRSPVAAHPEQPLVDAWRVMIEKNIKALPVVDAAGSVVGLLTHDDLIDRAGLHARLAVAQQLDEETLQAEMRILQSSGKQVRDVMSQPVITVQVDDPLGLAADRLVKNQITRMPVLDSRGKLAGMISRLDVLRQVMDMPAAAEQHAEARHAGRLAGEVMRRHIPSINEEAGLAQVVESFLLSGEHRVIVVDADGLPVGYISDSDVVRRIQPAHRRGLLSALRGLVSAPPLAITAREIMSPGVETIPADTTVVEAVAHMLAAQRKWLVVVDERGAPLGLIDREVALESLTR